MIKIHNKVTNNYSHMKWHYVEESERGCQTKTKLWVDQRKHTHTQARDTRNTEKREKNGNEIKAKEGDCNEAE